MAITRIGEDTKIIITGDPRQHDRGFENNGLVDLVDRCVNEDYIEHVRFIDTDVQRNKYIQRVLEMYDR
jgi:phosphate starvation-inducible protein PhoH